MYVCMCVCVCVRACWQVNELCAQSATQDELYDRLNVINDRLNSLKLDSDEVGRREYLYKL